MNRALFRLSLACLAMFVLLLLNVNYVQAFEDNSLANRPGNVRVFDQQFQYQRGSIIAAGDTGRGGQSVKIAESLPVKGTNMYQRSYPSGPMYAPVTGYDSILGKTGIEGAEEKYLAGTDSSLALQNDGGPDAGVVAINPSTGPILAMASVPTFDPTRYTTLDGTKLNKIDL